VSEPALRLCKELLSLTFKGVVELRSCMLLCFSVGFWTWLWSCSVMDLVQLAWARFFIKVDNQLLVCMWDGDGW